MRPIKRLKTMVFSSSFSTRMNKKGGMGFYDCLNMAFSCADRCIRSNHTETEEHGPIHLRQLICM